MFTLVNTWTGYHQGKPGVLREAVLVMRPRLLFHIPEVWCCKPSEMHLPRGAIAPVSPSGSNPQLPRPVVEPPITLFRQTWQQVIAFQLSKLLKFLDAALLSISCQKEMSVQDKLKQGRRRMPYFHLPSILSHFRSLQSKSSTCLLPHTFRGAGPVAGITAICFTDTAIPLTTV